jgi:site-specific recombinase XerD
MKFSEAIENYLKYIKVTKSIGTYNMNIGKTKSLNYFLGDLECSDINKNALMELILQLKERNSLVSNTTLNRYIQVTKRILKSECNIIIEFDKLTEEKKMVQVIKPQNLKRIFKYYSSSDTFEHLRNQLMFSLLLDTGLRISELLSLQVDNFDFESRTILVKVTKTKVHRYVFYTQMTQDLINRYLIKYKIKNYLFISLESKNLITVDTVEKVCSRLRKTLKIKQSISPHKWRHTFATNFVNKNGNMEVLRIVLGHSNLATTQRYLHVNSDKLRDEYNRIFWRA